MGPSKPDRPVPDGGGRVAAGVALFVFVVCAAFLPSTAYWLDAPEFIAAGFNLGQPHPPGHPFLVLLLKAFSSVPVGSIAFRANLLSATFGAVTAGLAALLAGDLAAVSAGERGVSSALAGAVAGVGAGLCASAVIQSQSIEVYTLNSALVLGSLVLALRRPGDGRAGVGIAVLLALGLANHHFLTVLAAPGVLVAWARRTVGWRPVVVAVGVGALVTVGGYLLLVARSLAGARPAWADAGDAAGLVWVASARIFAGSVGGFDHDGFAGNLARAIGLVQANLGAAGLAAAFAGLAIVAAGNPSDRGAGGWRALGIALVVAGTLASKTMMGILDPQNPDDHGYFLPAVVSLLALGAVTGAALLEASRRWRAPWRAVALAGGLALLSAELAFPVASGFPTLDARSRFDDTLTISRRLWAEQPPRGVLMLSHYATYFVAQYDQSVEGVRPDVTLVHESLYAKARGGAFYARRLAAEDPDLAPLCASFLASGGILWDDVVRLAKVRPVRLEAAPDFEVPAVDLRLAGSTFAVASPGVGVATVTAHEEVASLRRAFPGWPDLEPETRRVLLRNLVASADWLEKGGDRDGSRELLGAARELNPRDETLKRLESEL